MARVTIFSTSVNPRSTGIMQYPLLSAHPASSFLEFNCAVPIYALIFRPRPIDRSGRVGEGGGTGGEQREERKMITGHYCRQLLAPAWGPQCPPAMASEKLLQSNRIDGGQSNFTGPELCPGTAFSLSAVQAPLAHAPASPLEVLGCYHLH